MSTGRSITEINLGGEGEVHGMLNQQRPSVLVHGWMTSLSGDTLEVLAKAGNNVLICPNEKLAIEDDSIDLVVTNSVPIDIPSLGEPAVQSSEIRRILTSSGRWVNNGQDVKLSP